MDISDLDWAIAETDFFNISDAQERVIKRYLITQANKFNNSELLAQNCFEHFFIDYDGRHPIVIWAENVYDFFHPF